MTIHFRTLRSSSAANCVVVWSKDSRLIVDCGLKTMIKTVDVLKTQFGDDFRADAAVFTHMHSDHCSAYPLKALAKSSTPVFVHEVCTQQFRSLHCDDRLLDSLQYNDFDRKGVSTGRFRVVPFWVSHNPIYPTFGFNIYHKSAWRVKKISIVTDFFRPAEVLEHLIDSDLIYIESNYDPKLLKQFPNPNSRYHMPNYKTANLLCDVVKNSRKPPKMIVLGHLSHQRNTSDKALAQCTAAFSESALYVPEIICAPQFSPSEVFTVD